MHYDISWWNKRKIKHYIKSHLHRGSLTFVARVDGANIRRQRVPKCGTTHIMYLKYSDFISNTKSSNNI